MVAPKGRIALVSTYAHLSRNGRQIAYFRPEAKARTEELCAIDLTRPGFPVQVLSGGYGSSAG